MLKTCPSIQFSILRGVSFPCFCIRGLQVVKNWKVRARGQKKFHYANLRENPPLFMSQKHLLGQIRGGRQIWRKSLRGKLTIFWKIWFLAQKCKISKNDFFFKISTFNIKIWVEGCSLVYSDPLKVFPLSHSGFGNFCFFSDPKIGQNRKFAQNPPKHARKFFCS